MLREIIGTILFLLIPFLIIYVPIKIYYTYYQKICPYCDKYVSKKAIKCPYCQSDLRGK